MLIQEFIDDSAKEFISLAYIRTKYASSHFKNMKYKPLVKKIIDVIGLGNNEVLGNTISAVVVCIEEFNISEKELISVLSSNNIFIYMYDIIKDTDTVKEIINQSEIIHITIDPVTGEHKPVTAH